MKNSTKELIMNTAWKHFSMYGYTDTNLERICKDAGITRGPLYYYFKDKEDLYRQIVIRETDKMTEEYETILKSDGPLMDVVEKIMHLCTIYNPLLQRANNITSPDVPKIEETDALNIHVLELIDARFRKARQAGQVKDGTDILEMIYFLYTFALGIVTYDEKMNLGGEKSFYDKELAIKIFLKSFKEQYAK
ncbi:MAG: TetR/AcrR family transcriptional regulator [Oscillospiraceae bacterium]|nr:TetR/AcrR family transcriptional regulator [Oscillospiraceae bacterium]